MYILTSYIRGFTYYIRIENDVHGELKYSFQGLKNNATEFLTEEVAKSVSMKLNSKVVIGVEELWPHPKPRKQKQWNQ
jgi:hypothetical protein